MLLLDKNRILVIEYNLKLFILDTVIRSIKRIGTCRELSAGVRQQ